MKIKQLIPIAVILAIVLGFLGITADFNTYRRKSKTIPQGDGGLVFSLNTFDGSTEGNFFVKCLGHSWISLENNLDHPIYIKDYALYPGQMLTVSVWGIGGHFGVGFNMESEFARKYGRYQGMQSLSATIDEAKLGVIEEYIAAHDYWKFTENCSYWSLHLWNAVMEDDFDMKTQTVLYTPARVQRSFAEYDCVETDKDMSHAGKAFFYLDGVRTELELCK